MSLFLYRHAHITFDTQFNRCVVSLTIEQRTITVLLAVEVVFKAEDVIRTVLIHRCVGIRANDKRRIGAITNEDNG